MKKPKPYRCIYNREHIKCSSPTCSDFVAVLEGSPAGSSTTQQSPSTTSSLPSPPPSSSAANHLSLPPGGDTEDDEGMKHLQQVRTILGLVSWTHFKPSSGLKC